MCGTLMWIFSSPNTIRKKTESRLEQYSRPSVSFYLLILLSAAIATAGLIVNNTSIVIGAMVVAPLITPLFGASLHLLVFQWRGFFRDLLVLVSGTAATIAVSALLAFLIEVIEGTSIALTPEIISRTEPNLLYFVVALLSGVAGAYAYAKPDVLASLAGIAISVAVIPPLSVSGIGIVIQNGFVVQQSLLLFALNIAGILFGSILLFLSLGFAKDTSVR